MSRIASRNIIVVLPLVMLGLFGVSSYAQEGNVPDGEGVEDISPTAGDETAQRERCFEHYHFGSVQFDIDETGGTVQSYNAGQVVQVRGTLINPNNYPLPQGKIVAMIRREDDTVADNNWHPGVTQIILPQTYDLRARDSSPFDFSWQIPIAAPEGMYHVEFSYLAGGRYVISGLPYVTNFAGGRAFFTVTQERSAQAAHFLRDSVRLNKQPLSLRSVPPVLSAATPVTVDVNLTALGTTPVPVTLKKELHMWSSTDQGVPVMQQQEQITLRPGVDTPVSFSWTRQQPGAYELVVTATPQDPQVLPSMIKVRFPVAGNVPRIIYSGVGESDNDNVAVATCVVNATVGEGTGSVETQIIADGQVLETVQGSTSGDYLTATVAQVPRSAVAGTTLEVSTQAMDDQGNVTDNHTLTYSKGLLSTLRAQEPTKLLAPEEAQPVARPSKNNVVLLTVLSIVLVALVVVGVYVFRSRALSEPPSAGGEGVS